MARSTVVSNSQLRTYKRCKRKYWLTYYRKLKPVRLPFTGARQLGTRVHHALQAYYDIGQGVNGREAALSALGTLRTEEIEVVNATEYPDPEALKAIDKEHELAVVMVEGYCEWAAEEGVDANLEVIATEAALRTSSPVSRVELIGKLDTIVRNTETGEEGFLDHKTVGDLQTPLKTLHLDEQFRTYALMQRIKAGEEGRDPIRFQIYNMLKKSKRTVRAKPPFFSRYSVYISDGELRNFWVRLAGEIADILQFEQALDAGQPHLSVAYPSPDRACSWDCDFFNVCPLFDDPNADPEYLIESQFEVGDPHAHYEGKLLDPSPTEDAGVF